MGLDAFHGQVAGGAGAPGSIGKLAGVGLGVGDHVRQILEAHAGVGDQQNPCRADLGDGQQVFLRIVGKRRQHDGIQQDGGRGRKQQGVAIGLCLGHRAARDHAVGARL
ncbi:hypothetical protein D3C87_1471850 [compost metagenome]